MKTKSIKFIALLLSVVLLASVFAPFAVAAPAQEGLFEPDVPIDAGAYMLIALDDAHTLIAQKNKDKVKYPASLTKIATTMVTLENVQNLQEQVSVSQSAIDAIAGRDAQAAGLKAGQSVSYEQLLYLTMVYSACDACQVLAESVGKTEQHFAEMMNEWAASVGCQNTHFTNPDGLHDENHYTTAADMALMALAAINNETFLKLCTPTQYTFGETTFKHTNFMLDSEQPLYYYAYAKGIKTGSTQQAGYCVITMGEKDNMKYLAVVMDSPLKYIDGNECKGSFLDAKSLLEWGFAFKTATIASSSQEVKTIAVTDAKDADSVALVPKEDVQFSVPQNFNEADVTIVPADEPDTLYAPVKQGDVVCKADIIYNGQKLATTELVAASDVKLSVLSKIHRLNKAFITNHPIWFTLIVLVVLAVVFLIVQAVRRKKAKKRLAEKRRRRAMQQRMRDRNDNESF